MDCPVTKAYMDKCEVELSDGHRSRLDNDGFTVFSPPKDLQSELPKLRLVLDQLVDTEGWRGGWEGSEEHMKPGKIYSPGSSVVSNLFNKGKIFRRFANSPDIIGAAQYVIKGQIKIGNLHVRIPLVGTGFQRFHIDWKPRESVEDAFEGVAVFICLDGSRKENGGTRFIPGSHKKIGWPDDHINPSEEQPGEIALVCEPGSIVVFNSLLWHAGGNNTIGAVRRNLIMQVRKRELPQNLNLKQYLDNETLSDLSDLERYLLGVRPEDTLHSCSSSGPGEFYRKRFKQSAHVTSRRF